MNNPNHIRIIDLFSGAGGISVGFEWLSGRPYKTVWANDYNQYAVNTYNHNFGDVCVCGDIVNLLDSEQIHIPKADVVVGGPPCQGFSLLNKKRENDPRKKLWLPFMDVVQNSGAQAFVMENVPQLLGSLEFEEIVLNAKKRGFRTWAGILLAADYGVPQLRKRAFIVGSKTGEPSDYFPPKQLFYNPKDIQYSIDFSCGESSMSMNPWRTVRDAIGELPPPVGTEIRDIQPPLDIHFGRNPTPKSVARYKAIPKEGMNRFDLLKNAPELTPDCWIRKKTGGTDLFGRLWWDRPAFTIRTEFFKPEKGRYLHPEQHRPITHREAARFQSFPDSFIFMGSKIEIARQIGNAVPPLLASAIAQTVFDMISKSRDKSNGHIRKKETPQYNGERQKQEHWA